MGPYRIADLLGEGGMGEVYRAIDTRLGRHVAIKLLVSSGSDADRLRRFDVETRSVSSLQHVNILALYDVGQYEGRPFLVSELLQGETLRARLDRGPIGTSEGIDLALQLCRGLAAAHDKEIVHRDVKPENLFITREGTLKILDFGIAKRRGSDADERTGIDAASTTEVTVTGAVLGTAGYMSPEQVRGHEADERSDLFAAGAVLYEMFAGRRAFKRASVLETAYAIVQDEPEALPAHVPPAIANVVRRCLEKVRDARFQSARELAAALEPWAAASSSPPPLPISISAPQASPTGRAKRVARALLLVVATALAAGPFWSRARSSTSSASEARIKIGVLPFKDLSRDPQQAYFTDGLTDGLIGQLGRLQPDRLAVIARTSMAQYLQSKKTTKEIARDLGLRYLLECSMRREENQLRVDARLVQASDETQIWTQTFERDVRDVMQLQSAMARDIAGQLRVRLTSDRTAGLAKIRSLDPAAYDAYLRGRHFKDRSDPEGVAKAIFYLEQATKLDPGYAQAYAALANVTASRPMLAGARELDVGPVAKAVVRRALELDDELAAAHVALAFILLNYDWDWPQAEQHYRRAIELDPGNVDAHRSYAFNYFGSLCRHSEAIAEIERARELEPMALQANWMLGAAYLASGQYDRAELQLLRTIELHPRASIAHWNLGLVYDARGMHGEALVELEKAGATATSDDAGDLAIIGQIRAHAGDQAGAMKILRRMEELARSENKPSAESMATLYATLRRPDDAFAWLEEAYEQRRYWLIFLRCNPDWIPLRADPRFEALARRIGIPAMAAK